MHDTNNQTVYTRNGQFKLDANGYIVNNDKQKLQGYAVDLNSMPTGTLIDLQMPTSGIPPKPSTEGILSLNLDARKNINDTYSTSLTTYDSQGIESTVTFNFEKTAANTWAMTHAVNGVDSGTTVPMTFNAGGNLVTPATITANGVVMDISSSTQWGSSSNVTKLSQNGYTSGDLVSVSMQADGKVLARYTNGQSSVAGQVELASFPNPQGLQSLGNNSWGATPASGARIPNYPGAGNMGVLQSGALEDSNVDITAELVNMITAQRNYQANAQTIKTQDQVMQTLVNLR
jgi:flagellar hook protein FlgE